MKINNVKYFSVLSHFSISTTLAGENYFSRIFFNCRNVRWIYSTKCSRVDSTSSCFHNQSIIHKALYIYIFSIVSLSKMQYRGCLGYIHRLTTSFINFYQILMKHLRWKVAEIQFFIASNYGQTLVYIFTDARVIFVAMGEYNPDSLI